MLISAALSFPVLGENKFHVLEKKVLYPFGTTKSFSLLLILFVPECSLIFCSK